MQDYNYIWGACLEITLELSCCKYPSRRELPRYWRENQKSLLVYLAEVHRGIRGLVTDANGNAVIKANLKIKGRDINFKSSKRGEFWRLLLPGLYTIEASADGYHPLEQQFSVQDGQVTYLNLQLTPIGFVSNNSLANVTLTPKTNNISDNYMRGLNTNYNRNTQNKYLSSSTTNKFVTPEKKRFNTHFRLSKATTVLTTEYTNETIERKQSIIYNNDGYKWSYSTSKASINAICQLIFEVMVIINASIILLHVK